MYNNRILWDYLYTKQLYQESLKYNRQKLVIVTGSYHDNCSCKIYQKLKKESEKYEIKFQDPTDSIDYNKKLF